MKKWKTKIINLTKNYYKHPYLGIISKQTQKKLRKLGKELCKGIDITLCFSVCKIGSFLPLKVKIFLPSNPLLSINTFVLAEELATSVKQQGIGWLG